MLSIKDKLLVIVTLLVLFPTVATAFDVDGLEFADVDAEFHEDENVTLQGDYVETNLTARELFVPDDLYENFLVDDFTYSLQTFDEEEWPDTEAQLFLQILYTHYTNEEYPNEELSAVLGGEEDVGNWTGHQYGFDDTVQVNRSDGTTSVAESGWMTSTESVQGQDQDRTRYQVDVSTHYEYVVVEYTVQNNVSYEVNGSTEYEWRTVETLEDVYEAGEPDKVPILGNAHALGDNLQRHSVTVDNRYGEQDWKQLYLVHEPGTSIHSVDFGGQEYSECSMDYEEDVEPELDAAGVTDNRVDSTDGWNTACYNVSIASDSQQTLKVTYHEEDQFTDSFLLSNSYEYYGYVLGSGASFSVESRTDWNDGSFDGTSADRDDHSGDLGIGYPSGESNVDTTMTGYDSLELQYRFDADNTGDQDTVPDFSGNNNDGTNLGTQNFVDGVFGGGAFEFNKNDDDEKVRLDNSQDKFKFFMEDRKGTFATWVKPESGTGEDVIAGNERSGSQTDVEVVFLLDEEDMGIFLRDGSGTAMTNDDYQDTNVNLGEWVLLVWVLDDDEVRFYADGNLEATDTSLSGGTTDDYNDDWHFGGPGRDDNIDRVIDYPMAEAMIFSEPLSDAQVEQLYFRGMDGTFEGDYDSDVIRDGETDDQEWTELTYDSTVPTDTDADWAFTVLDDDGETVIDTETGSVTDGGDTHTLDVDDGPQAQVSFDGTSTNEEETWTVEEFSVNYEDAVDDPEVETDPATDVDHESATLHGDLTDLGDENSVVAFFEYRETGSSEWTETEIETLSTTGTFNEDVTDLDDETEYEFRAVVEWDYGNEQDTGDTLTFTTDEIPPPQWKNLDDNATALNPKGSVVNISALFKSAEGMDRVQLATNESGTLQNGSALLEETFEDQNTEGWTGDTDAFTIRPWEIAGDHSGVIDCSSDEQHTVETPAFAARDSNVQTHIHINNTLSASDQSSADETRIYLTSSNGSTLGSVHFRDFNHVFRWNTNEDKLNDDEWHEDTVYEFDFQPDFEDQEFDIYLNGEHDGTYAFNQTGSDIGAVSFECDLTDTANEGTKYVAIDNVTVDDRTVLLHDGAEDYTRTTFLWRNSSVTGPIEYELWGGSSAGQWSQTERNTIGVNRDPTQRNATLTWQSIGGDDTKTLMFGYAPTDDIGIRSVASPPSGMLTGTNNHTTTVSGWSSPFDWKATVMDKFGQQSPVRQINFTADAQHVHAENVTGVVNTGEQTVNTSVALDVRGDPMNYSITAAQPDAVQEAVRDDDETTTTGVTGMIEKTWYWIVDHITTDTFDYQDNTTASNVSMQYYATDKQLTNTDDIDFSRVNVTPPDMDGECVNCEFRETAVDGTDSVNETYNSSGDFIDTTNFDFAPQTGEVTLGVNYIGDRPLQLDNQQPFSWTDLGTTPGVSEPDGCEQTNNTQVGLAGGATTNYTVEFSCDPGHEGEPGLVKDIDATSANDTRYSYETDNLTITSNETRDVNVTWAIDKDELNDWSDRMNHSAEINGDDTGVEVEDTANEVRVTFTTDCCSSSPAEGEHDAQLIYFVDEEDTTEVTTPTGGTVIRDDEDDPDVEVRFTTEVYDIPFEVTSIEQFEVVNRHEDENTVNIERGDDPFCEYVEVQRTLTSDMFGMDGTYVMPERSHGIDPGQSTQRVDLRVEMPDEDTFDDLLVNETAQCRFETEASHGAAGDLVIEVASGDPFLERVNQWFRNRGIPAPFTTATFCLDVEASLDDEAECSLEDELEVVWPAFPTGVALLILMIVALGVFVYAAVRTAD